MCHRPSSFTPLKITHIDQGCNENLLKDDYLKTPGCWPKVSFNDGHTVSWRPRPRGSLKFCFTDRYGDFWDATYDQLVDAHITAGRDYDPSNWKEPTYEAFTA